MARLIAVTPLHGLGLPLVIGSARLSEVELGAVTSIAPFQGKEAAVARALGGAALPVSGQAEHWGEARLIWSGPGRFLLVGRQVPEGLSDIAAVVEQGDGIAAAVLQGAAAHDVLARLVPLDLREASFPGGATARTLLSHMTVTLSRVGPDAYEVMTFRGMGATLVREIAEAMRHVAARAVAGV